MLAVKRDKLEAVAVLVADLRKVLKNNKLGNFCVLKTRGGWGISQTLTRVSILRNS